uniref:Uncharacterized protein n=1 Tax=Caenorhabditis japonica TaxID=281687 RepID=A0A8R1E6F7_CAEJA
MKAIALQMKRNAPIFVEFQKYANTGTAVKNCGKSERQIINEEIIDEMVVPTSSAISYDGPLPKPEELSLRFNTVLSNAFQPQLQNPRPANIMIPAIVIF